MANIRGQCRIQILNAVKHNFIAEKTAQRRDLIGVVPIDGDIAQDISDAWKVRHDRRMMVEVVINEGLGLFNGGIIAHHKGEPCPTRWA